NAGTVPVTVFTPAPGGGQVTPAQTFTINNPQPAVSTLPTPAVIAGGGEFQLTVNGSNFVNTSKVRWNGDERPTSFVSATQIKATISASDIATAGTAAITVFSPTPGGGVSPTSLTFTINNPAPSIAALGPSSVKATGPSFTLIV